MLVQQLLQLAVLATAALWQPSSASASPVIKICGRQLGDIMSRVCHAYNSPYEPRVVVRRKRQALGIADQCCNFGCSWEHLNEYCSVSAYSESPLQMSEHAIEDRSAEAVRQPSPPAESGDGSREVGRGGRRSRRCRCGRRRRHRPASGNMVFVRSVARAAPVVGTVSPLLIWGRTLNTDLPPTDGDRYAYAAVYT